MIGWSAPTALKLKDGDYGFEVSDEDNAWIGSLATLGGAFACFPAGFLMERIGRKTTMLLMIAPFTLGWTLIVFAINLPMIFVGRFISGFAGASFCVVAPTYTSEIAEDNVKGTLGTLFQLMYTIGILFCYLIGSYVKVQTLSILCGLIPMIFGCIFYFMPETPHFLIKKFNVKHAKDALIWLRGHNECIDEEFHDIENKINYNHKNPVSFKDTFSQKAPLRAFIICLSLMFFQQFSGINAVLFNTTEIFNSAGMTTRAEISTIIIGVIQVISTFLSAVVIEKLGRRILLLISSIAMGVCGILLGAYFHLKSSEDPDQIFLEKISYLPLFSLCLFIVAFSLGFGPIPWLVSNELCSPNIKAFVSSSAATFNWIIAFIITRTFVDMREDLTEAGAFWFFALITFIGTCFVYFVVPETKGKSNAEMQVILKGKTI